MISPKAIHDTPLEAENVLNLGNSLQDTQTHFEAHEPSSNKDNHDTYSDQAPQQDDGFQLVLKKRNKGKAAQQIVSNLLAPMSTRQTYNG